MKATSKLLWDFVTLLFIHKLWLLAITTKHTELKKEKVKLEQAHSKEIGSHDKEIAYNSKRDKGEPTR